MKKYSVRWSRLAERDLNKITEYIAHNNIDAALRLFEELRQKCDALSSFPERGRVVPELAIVGVNAYRELIHKNWRIIYRISGKTVRVHACFDARRHVESLLMDRFLD